MRNARWLAVVSIFIPAATTAAEPVRLNQVQVIGTHNSYHIAPHASIMKLIARASEEQAAALDYTHRPLPEQFTHLGVRQIELDVFADPEGGHYAHPVGPRMAAEAGLANVPEHDPDGELREPGLKVFHVPDIDFATTVRTFVGALQQVKAWSQQHPYHVPIMIMIEVKDDQPLPGMTKPKPFDNVALDTIDQEILSVFEPSDIVSPDSVRGDAGSLRESVTTRGWPLLKDVRGKVMFALDNGGPVRDAYLKGHPSLAGRLLFVSVNESHPAAAFMKLNDAIGQFEHIRKMVERGFLVRTRADSNTGEARENDTARRDQALASGAQFVSTDYPEPNPAFSPYCVRFEDGVVVRSNPVNGDGSQIDSATGQ